MTCVPGPPQFRLLDAYVGWDARQEGLVGLDDPRGIRLRVPADEGVPADFLSRYLPPPWFACRAHPREWYLLVSGPSPGLLRWDACREVWADILPELAGSASLKRPAAVKIAGHLLAVSDPATGRVFVWSLPDGRLSARIDVDAPGPLAFAPWGELIVGLAPPGSRPGDKVTLRRFSRSGEPRSPDLVLDPGEPLRRLGAGWDGALWAAVGPAEGPFRLWRAWPGADDPAGAEGPPVAAGTPAAAPPCDPPHVFGHSGPIISGEALPGAFGPTGLVVASERGFCVEVRAADESSAVRCFLRGGEPARRNDVEVADPDSGALKRGTLVTRAPLDSGIPRCRWDRVRVDADIPLDTELTIEVATSEHPDVPPSPGDFEALISPRDALFQGQPAGRYLHIRLVLQGTGGATPVVRRVRFDFPRSTSLDRLPPVYRDNPDAEDFTERFLSLFDATIADIDRRIGVVPSLLDPSSGPQEVLPWLGGLLGLRFDPSWDARLVRDLIRAAPELYRTRGTAAGLARVIKMLFGIDPVIDERAGGRSWGGLGTGARLRGVRLFGKARSRFRLGRSALGAAPMLSFGDPDDDPFRELAHRFSVLIPPSAVLGPRERDQLERLIDEQKPAHAVHSLRMAGDAFILGPWSAVGVDTRLVSPGPPVLGGRGPADPPGNAFLNRTSLLAPGRKTSATGLRLGQAGVGIRTVLE